VHPALLAVRDATIGTPFEGDLWLVGGAVRDELLGVPQEADFDLVTTRSSADLARLLWDRRVSSIPPVTYERFGTAMVQVGGGSVEIVTARKESYEHGSRKPQVEPATLEEDALRRDFTVNTLMRSLHTGELYDPLGKGLDDLRSGVLRTPLDALETFKDDPLRMLRAVRFRWKLGFEPSEGLYDAVQVARERLRIVSFERIRDEFLKMLAQPTAPDALDDLMRLGLFELFAPELPPMVGCEQGKWHHLDVWGHSLLVLRNAQAAAPGDRTLALAALLHDVAKPPTRSMDDAGNTRFFGHETLGAEMTGELLRRLKLPQREIDPVVGLVRSHMRFSSFEHFTESAARRLVRDLGDDLERLLLLVEADADALKPGVKTLDLGPVRAQIAKVLAKAPRHSLESPLSGAEIMEILGLREGPQIGRVKALLTEKVLEGEIEPGDAEGARRFLREHPPL
jgi:poly(A) polymerase